MPPIALLLSLALVGPWSIARTDGAPGATRRAPVAREPIIADTLGNMLVNTRADTLDATSRRDTIQRVAGSPSPSPSPGRHIAEAATRILLSASWSQLLGTPNEWKRTPEGFARRFGDQGGVYTIQRTTRWALDATLDWHADVRPCPERAVVRLATCALGRTLSARDDGGAWHPPVPLVASVGTATLVSLAWRPERHDASDARMFVVTRMGLLLAGKVGQRLFEEWRRR